MLKERQKSRIQNWHFFAAPCGLCGLFLALFWAGVSASASSPDYPLDLVLPGPKSIYTEVLLKNLMHWTASPLSRPQGVVHDARTVVDEALVLRCVQTPGQPYFIGVEQFQRVHTSLDQVAKVLDNIDDYEEIFHGFRDVQVTHRDRNHWLTLWKQLIPIPFVSDVIYQVDYLVVQSTPERRIYRYQLHQSGDLISSDGFIVLEAEGPTNTRYFEYDFYDAHWGIAKMFGKEKLWQENVEGLALSDLGVKIKAEQSSLSGEQVRARARSLLKERHVDVKCARSVSASEVFPDLVVPVVQIKEKPASSSPGI